MHFYLKFADQITIESRNFLASSIHLIFVCGRPSIRIEVCWHVLRSGWRAKAKKLIPMAKSSRSRCWAPSSKQQPWHRIVYWDSDVNFGFSYVVGCCIEQFLISSWNCGEITKKAKWTWIHRKRRRRLKRVMFCIFLRRDLIHANTFLIVLHGP